MHKHGFSTIIFKWILGTVAGALILTFFVRFAYQHVQLSQTLNVRELTEHLDDQLEAFGIAESSTKTITLGTDATLTTTCTTFGFGDATKKTNKILFAPTTLEGDTIQAWTETWNSPFKIANLYYLSNKNTRILLIYDDTTETYTKNLQIPKLFNLQKIHTRNFNLNTLKRESSTLHELHLAFFTPVTNPDQLINAFPFPVHVIEINPNLQRITHHNTKTVTTYPSEELLTGALFNPEDYPCILAKALERKTHVATIYQGKTSHLRLKTNNPTCDTTLFETIRTLETFKTLTDTAQLRDSAQRLEEQNQYLQKHDCPTLY